MKKLVALLLTMMLLVMASSAMAAGKARGGYDDPAEAISCMGDSTGRVYEPDAAAGTVYDQLYAAYSRLYDHFGKGGDNVMHELLSLKN